MGPVSLTSLNPLYCTGGMSAGLYFARSAHLGVFSVGEEKSVGVSAVCDMHSCSGVSNEW